MTDAPNANGSGDRKSLDFSLDLLIKLMMMTTSTADQEALAAIRRANSWLKSKSATWEDVLRAKITIMEDPFAKLETPNADGFRARPQPAPHRPGTPPPRQAPSPPPRPAAPSTHPCRDCGIPISLQSLRCTSCYVKHQRAQRPPQPDPSCVWDYSNRRWSPPKPHPDCTWSGTSWTYPVAKPKKPNRFASTPDLDELL